MSTRNTLTTTRDSRAIGQVYSDQLLPHGKGVALFDPAPWDLIPVQVGDVGQIVRGQFRRGFNIFYGVDDPLHRSGVPEGFQPLHERYKSCAEQAPLFAGALSSETVVHPNGTNVIAT